jgi:hypothetical protein
VARRAQGCHRKYIEPAVLHRLGAGDAQAVLTLIHPRKRSLDLAKGGRSCHAEHLVDPIMPVTGGRLPLQVSQLLDPEPALVVEPAPTLEVLHGQIWGLLG